MNLDDTPEDLPDLIGSLFYEPEEVEEDTWILAPDANDCPEDPNTWDSGKIHMIKAPKPEAEWHEI